MIRGVLGSRASIGGVLGSGRGGAAAAWYLAGGVSAANCVAAYTPKGAASLAASYDNNAAPGNGLADGTYDAAPGVAPTFDTATGWTFNGSTQYLITGIVPANSQSWSMVVRFSDAVIPTGIRIIAGGRGAVPAYYFDIWHGYNGTTYYGNGTEKAGGGSVAQGVKAVAGTTGYLNGSVDCSSIGTGGTTPAAVSIGAFNNDGSAAYYFSGKIQAFAIYNVTLDAATVAAISTAMAAL